MILVALLQALAPLADPLFAMEYQPDQLRSRVLAAAALPIASEYVLQIGAFQSLANARYQQEAANSIVPSLHIVETVDADGNPLFRIVSENFATREAADLAARQLRAQNYPTIIYRIAQQPQTAKPEPVESEPSPSTEPIAATSEQSTPLEKANTLALSQDEERPDQQFTTLLFGRPLRIGGKIESENRYRRDFRLNDALEDDDFNVDIEFKLELLYTLADEIFVYVEGTIQAEADLYAEDGVREESEQLRRGQTWLYVDRLSDTDFSLQVGRQDFEDKREWWWDRSLDAVRLHYEQPEFQAEIGLAEELGRISTDKKLSPEAKDITRFITRASWKWMKNQRLELFFLSQNDHSGGFTDGDLLPESDEDEVDADLNWFGVRAMGRVKAKPLGRLYYWADYGLVQGNESIVDFDDTATPGIRVVDDTERFNVDGWGFDVGVTLQSKRDAPSYTLGYAYGSGDDDPTDGTDHAFRQTGLQDNNARFRGVESFRYYGELLQPELSNLQIVTASLGIPLLTKSSIEILYHYYRQVEAAPDLRGDDLRARPLGIDRSIGSEIDVVVALEEWKQVDMEIVFGLFRSGSAFGPLSGETASIATFTVDYKF